MPRRDITPEDEELHDLPEPIEEVEVPGPALAPAAVAVEPTRFPPLIERKPHPAELKHLGKVIEGLMVQVSGMGYDRTAQAILDILQRPITL